MRNDNSHESAAIVTGLGMVCLALFAGVSLYTYSPYDVMDYHAAESLQIENRCGILGALLAHHLFALYGAGAWVLTVAALVLGSLMCALRSMSGVFLRAIGALLLTLLVCTWCGALNPTTGSGEYPAGPGGLVGGTFLAPALVGYFGHVGIFMVLVAVGIMACLLLEQSLTEAALALLGRMVVRAASSFGNWILGKTRNAIPLQPARPALAGGVASGSTPRVGSRRDETDTAQQPAHFEVLATPRKSRGALSTLLGKGGEGDRKSGRDEAPHEKPETARRNAKIDAAKAESGRRSSKLALLIDGEAEEAERRRSEALRQADAAETERLERERQAREQYQRELKALERLEKERATQTRERTRQQEKFAAAMAKAAGAAADPAAQSQGGSEPAGEPKPAKRELPVDYTLPRYDLLIENDISPTVTSELLKDRAATLIQTLWEFKIGARLAGIQSGPTVTVYELELDPGIRVQRVVSLQHNIEMKMEAENGVRIIAPIPGRATIGIEVPNREDHTVRMRPVLESPQFRSKSWTLPLILGRDAIGNPLIADLDRMPHLLIAGTTGSGKSVCVNSIILSLMILRRPHEVKLILVDPKQVEMTDFKGIPHLLSPVVTDMKLAAGVLTWAVQKMEERYERMSRTGVRNITSYNKMTAEERTARLPQGESPEDFKEAMPYIVIIVDEFADLMMTAGKEIEQAIARLAQKARAAGIHVILATQRPSADVVTGLIKTNLPCRICFQVKSKIDSRIVLDVGGGEKLAGKGDMLFVGAGNSNIIRAKGIYISDEEIRNVVKACKDQAEPIYSDEVERVAAEAVRGGEGGGENNRQAIELDDKFDEGVEVFLAHGRASTSLLQRRLGLGYTRAAKLCDQMEARGIVGPDRGPKGRELLITQESWDQFKNARNSNFIPPGGEPPLSGVAAVVSAPAFPDDGDGSELAARADPALLEQLDNIDGVKDDEDDE